MNKRVPLTEQLKAQRRKSESQREKRQVDVMHLSTSDLIKQGIEKTALQTGDAIPRIKLKNTHGNVVDVVDLLKSGIVVLVFYRGSWCPYCNLTLRAYQEKLADIRNYGSQLVAVSPELHEISFANAKEHGLQFEILSDAGNLTAKQFGLAYKMPLELVKVYLELGRTFRDSTATTRGSCQCRQLISSTQSEQLHSRPLMQNIWNAWSQN